MISIADRPDDDDDTRLRKRVGVVAGYFTIVAPVGVTFSTPTVAASRLGDRARPLAVECRQPRGPSPNEAVRTLCRRTDRGRRAVHSLLQRARRWSDAHSRSRLGVPRARIRVARARSASRHAVVLRLPRNAHHRRCHRPHVGGLFAPPPYVAQLIFYVQGVGVPLTVTFLLLRYVDIRRRNAEAEIGGAPDERHPVLDRDAPQARRSIGSPSHTLQRPSSSPTSSASPRERAHRPNPRHRPAR